MRKKEVYEFVCKCGKKITTEIITGVCSNCMRPFEILWGNSNHE